MTGQISKDVVGGEDRIDYLLNPSTPGRFVIGNGASAFPVFSQRDTLPMKNLINTHFGTLLFASALSLWATGSNAQEVASQSPLPNVKHLIDTHIHLFDPRRPQGIPWPPADDKVLYKPHLPAEFSRLAKPAGVSGVVIVEASDRLEDNNWVLDQVKGDPFYVALVGNIDPYREDFDEQLKRLKQDKRFVGIRARNSGPIDYTDPQVLANFRVLEKAGLSLDILANGKGVEGVREVDELAAKLPNLQIVVDHVLGYDIDGNPPGKEWLDAVKSLARHKNVFCKVSGLYQRCTQQPAPHDPDHYRTVLDPLWEGFGADRLIYGSNWPCTKKSGDYDSFVRLVNAYFSEKGQDACEKYFWKNAATAYHLPLR
jgi:predicted TIM-barrel fold metal-dependent hydrolase